MRSAVLSAPHRIDLAEIPTPAPGPGQVLVRLRAVGICGSDVHYYADGRIGSAVVEYPFVLGHEPAGEIAALGAGIAGLAVGDRVALEPAYPCGVCPTCREGRLNCCPSVEFLGTPPVGGVFEEYHLFHAEQCVPLPDAITFEAAATLEPMAVALHAVNLARPRLGARVAVMGGGPVGMLTAMAARLAGASFIALTEPIPARRALAARFGVDLALDPQSGDAVAEIKRAAGEIDVAFEAAGTQEAVDDATLVVGPGGTAVIIGIPSVDRISLRAHELRRKELNLIMARRSNHALEPAIRLMRDGRIDPGRIVTHRFPLTNLAEAMDLVHVYGDGVLKAMVVMD
ncbi:MAG: zinc-dependent alcohol dehydrogenase [Bacteroidota bacterium]